MKFSSSLYESNFTLPASNNMKVTEVIHVDMPVKE